MKHYPPIIIVLGLGMFCGTEAATPLISSPGGGPAVTISNGATVGALFQVGPRALSIESLGLYDDVPPGLTSSHSVGLWSETGSLLARADFPPGMTGSLENGFIYQNLGNPIILQPGHRYVLGTDYPVGSLDTCRVNGSAESESWSGAALFLNGRYTQPGVGFVLPNFNVFGLSYAGANAQYVVVPEPGPCGLLVLGVGTLLVWRGTVDDPSRRRLPLIPS